MEQLDERWRQPMRGPLHRVPTVTAEGLVLGCGTLLLRLSSEASGSIATAELQRALALLRLAGLEPPTHAAGVLAKALAAFASGDRCLAHIRLAQLGLGALAQAEDARRLFLGAALLDAGAPPSAFAVLLGGARPEPVAKYDPAQPRVPAGSGRESGRWARIAGAVATLATLAGRQAARAAAEAVPSLAGALSAQALAYIERLAARAVAASPAAAAFLGGVLIPSPNSGIAAEGELPGGSGLRYRLDRDTGVLRLYDTSDGEDGAAALTAQLGADGRYHDLDTGVAVARAVGGAVLLDIDRAAGVETATQARRDEPKLCPAPVPDRAGGRKLFDEMYEQFVRGQVNPQRQPPLPPGLTFALLDSATGRWVHYDDCRESDGAMIDAKGNYADMVADRHRRKWLTISWVSQAMRQLRAAGRRRVEWYFHDRAAAAFARTLFEKNNLAIGIHVLPHPLGVPKPNPRIR